MKKDNIIYIRHIIECIDKIQKYLSGKSWDNFNEDDILQDAVVRQFEIMGEATKKIETEFRDLHPEIAWKKMAGLRDVLIHNYIDVNFDLLWEIQETVLPELRIQIAELLKTHEDSGY